MSVMKCVTESVFSEFAKVRASCAFAPYVPTRLRAFVCVCVCVFTSIHREGFICLGLEFQGTDQQCCVEDVSFLCQVSSSIL